MMTDGPLLGRCDEQGLELARRVLVRGGVAVLPTDTLYGLTAVVEAGEAVERVRQIKGRDRRQPFPLLIGDAAWLDGLTVGRPPWLGSLVERLWPGALTLVLAASDRVPASVTGPDGGIGLRMPGHDWLRELLCRLDMPLIGTSANRSGEQPVSSVSDVFQELAGERIDLVVDGGRLLAGEPSTVIDCRGMMPACLREGAVPMETIQEALFSTRSHPLASKR